MPGGPLDRLLGYVFEWKYLQKDRMERGNRIYNILSISLQNESMELNEMLFIVKIIY